MSKQIEFNETARRALEAPALDLRPQGNGQKADHLDDELAFDFYLVTARGAAE